MLIERPLIAQREIAKNAAVPSAASGAQALIGPHAVIHMAQAMHHALGSDVAHQVMASAQITALPSGDAMNPEIEALRLHHQLMAMHRTEGFAIARDAARRTADYIIANRIPAAAAALLRVLPARLAAPMLMHSIRSHAWTFIGAGQFEPHSAWTFTIDRNRADDRLRVPDSTFGWYGAVFERLYQRLVAPDCRIEMAPVNGPAHAACQYRLAHGAVRHCSGVRTGRTVNMQTPGTAASAQFAKTTPLS